MSRPKNPPHRPFKDVDVGERFRMSRFTETMNMEHLGIPGRTVYVKTGRYGARPQPKGRVRECHLTQATWKP